MVYAAVRSIISPYRRTNHALSLIRKKLAGAIIFDVLNQGRNTGWVYKADVIFEKTSRLIAE